MATALTLRILDAIRAVPYGKVASYGQIALVAGHPRGAGGARDVVRILASMSEKQNLPWWRIVRKDGSIALSPGPHLGPIDEVRPLDFLEIANGTHAHLACRIIIAHKNRLRMQLQTA